MRHLPTLLLCLGALLSTSAANAQGAPKTSDTKNKGLSFSSGDWGLKLYGFVEADSILDTTQSYNDLAGGARIARPGSYAAEHGRMTFGLRNSRIGFKIKAPSFGVFKPSAMFEMDFQGNQPSNVSQAGFFTGPGFRMRHAILKVEDPYVDVTIGQTWSLFGWQAYFHPGSVQIQGVSGQVFVRTPQIRFSHTFSTDPVNFEIAMAAQRPAERDSMVPDGVAGMRVLFNHVTALHTVGSAGTNADPAGLGISGLVRRFSVPEFSDTPQNAVNAMGWGVSLDALVPIIQRTKEDRANALTLTGSFVRGSGTADQYTGFNAGLGFPAIPVTPGNPSPAAYPADVDNGLVTFDANGQLQVINWQSFMVGVQYYLPPSGRVFITANYSQMSSDNAGRFGNPANVFNKSRWADVNLFWTPVDALRFGLEYAYSDQTYADGVKAHNHRGQFSGFFIF